jgi:diguanylate cyclase (GGDEF)-like protein
MKFKGRIFAFLIVLIINVLYMLHYFFRDGFISFIEYTGLPLLLSLAWWSGKQYDIAKYYSEKDTLTGLYNRRFVEKFINKNRQKAQNFALLLLDVNDFKLINDVYGHKAGDQYLKAIATRLIKSVNRKDLVARWGGDEFLIISTDFKNKETIAKLVETIQQNISDTSPTNFEIGISIGMAYYPSEGKDFDELLKIADRKMYKMKSQKVKTYQMTSQ